MRILVTYSTQEEFTELKFPGLIGEDEVQIGYLRTGMGKTKSAFYLSEAINHGQPDLVVNVGTAGTLRHRVGDIIGCCHFVDRDLKLSAEFGAEYEIDSSELLAQKGYCQHWKKEGVCNTGDTFQSDASDIEGDVVDMEAFAQAFVCRAKNVPFIAVKYVTDVIGENSAKSWAEKHVEARKALSEYFEQLGGAVK